MRTKFDLTNGVILRGTANQPDGYAKILQLKLIRLQLDLVEKTEDENIRDIVRHQKTHAQQFSEGLLNAHIIQIENALKGIDKKS